MQARTVNSRRRASNVVSEWNHALCALGREIVQTSLRRSSVWHENVETKNRSHDAVETCGEVPERSAKEGTAGPRTEPSKAHLEVHVDSDWARDTVTRRSTSGVIVRRGRYLLRHSSTVQNVIGLSSAESEYYALTKGGCSGLGLQSLFADWNLKLQLSLHTDSSSAEAIASRRELVRAPVYIQRGCYGCKNV